MLRTDHHLKNSCLSCATGAVVEGFGGSYKVVPLRSAINGSYMNATLLPKIEFGNWGPMGPFLSGIIALHL